jgi:NADH-quinone oxidoreductase subunit A
MFLSNYLNLFFFLLLTIILSFIIFALSFLLSSKQDNKEKLASYECGFNPFEDSRMEFDVKFYLIAILFIIFDLEVSFLFPFIMCFDQIGLFGLEIMYFFLLILTFGFIYEWKKGALDWT